MHKIIGLNGEALAPGATETKKAHDPAELQREQERLNGLLQTWFRSYMQDVRTPEGQVRVVLQERNAVRDLYASKWREQAQIMNNSGFPHEVDADAFDKVVDQWEAQERAELEQGTPLHQLSPEVLRKYELYPVGTNTDKAGIRLYANSAVAVNVYETGRVLVWVRPANLRMEDWAQDVYELAVDNLWPPVVDSDNYQLGLLLRLYDVLRVPSVAEIPAHLVVAGARAEHNEDGSTDSSWWPREFTIAGAVLLATLGAILFINEMKGNGGIHLHGILQPVNEPRRAWDNLSAMGLASLATSVGGLLYLTHTICRLSDDQAVVLKERKRMLVLTIVMLVITVATVWKSMSTIL